MRTHRVLIQYNFAASKQSPLRPFTMMLKRSAYTAATAANQARPAAPRSLHQALLTSTRHAAGSAPSTSGTAVPEVNQFRCRHGACVRATEGSTLGYIEPEEDIPGMSSFLDSVKWDSSKLVPVIVQHVDTGELLMQAYADRAALSETLQTGLATFYSRARQGRWCKGETSGNYINVHRIFSDCDGDSIVYLSSPIGPACHTGAKTCWFSEVQLEDHEVQQQGHSHDHMHVPLTTLLQLEHTIMERKAAMAKPIVGKPSWTARLLGNPTLLCSKVREEASELCQTLERNEGKERAANEMADLMYHAMVLLNMQGVPMEEVLRVLRLRFSQSGVDEKARRLSADGGSCSSVDTQQPLEEATTSAK